MSENIPPYMKDDRLVPVPQHLQSVDDYSKWISDISASNVSVSSGGTVGSSTGINTHLHTV